MLKYGDIYCQRCGVTWHGPKCGIKYCEKCRTIIAREKSKNCNAKRREQERAEKNCKEKGRDTFHDIVKKADAEGLSYGKYCLKYGI